MNRVVYLGMLLMMTLLGSAASLFLKKASSSRNLSEMLRNRNFYIGGLLYLSSAVLNILVLRHLYYSVVLPLTSITYVWTLMLSYFILKEKITGKQIAGVILIFTGAVCVSV